MLICILFCLKDLKVLIWLQLILLYASLYLYTFHFDIYLFDRRTVIISFGKYCTHPFPTLSGKQLSFTDHICPADSWDGQRPFIHCLDDIQRVSQPESKKGTCLVPHSFAKHTLPMILCLLICFMHCHFIVVVTIIFMFPAAALILLCFPTV